MYECSKNNVFCRVQKFVIIAGPTVSNFYSDFITYSKTFYF